MTDKDVFWRGAYIICKASSPQKAPYRRALLYFGVKCLDNVCWWLEQIPPAPSPCTSRRSLSSLSHWLHILPRLTFSLSFPPCCCAAGSLVLHPCPSSLRRFGGSCHRTGSGFGGRTSSRGLLAFAACCLHWRQQISQSISFFLFFFFADGIGDVLSHLRKQVEILFNTRYGELVIDTCV